MRRARPSYSCSIMSYKRLGCVSLLEERGGEWNKSSRASRLLEEDGGVSKRPYMLTCCIDQSGIHQAGRWRSFPVLSVPKTSVRRKPISPNQVTTYYLGLRV